MTYANDMSPDAELLARAVARLNRRLRQERQTNLTPTQLSVLGTIRKLGPCSPSTIAAYERVQPPSIARTIGHLMDEGLALREPHPTDGRQVLVSISDKGENVLAEERGRRDEWLAQRLDELKTDDRAALRRAAVLLEQLATA